MIDLLLYAGCKYCYCNTISTTQYRLLIKIIIDFGSGSFKNINVIVEITFRQIDSKQKELDPRLYMIIYVPFLPLTANFFGFKRILNLLTWESKLVYVTEICFPSYKLLMAYYTVHAVL